MNKKKIAQNFVDSMQAQRKAEAQICQAFAALGSDNQIFALAEPIEGAYTTLVAELLGEQLFDWLMWWMYDCDYGTENMEFTTNYTTYNPQDLTLEKFIELVDAP
jgi:hypothetical protein